MDGVVEKCFTRHARALPAREAESRVRIVARTGHSIWADVT